MISCPGKSYSMISAIIYCAWPEGPEFGTGEEIRKGLQNVGTWQIFIEYTRKREDCCMGGSERVILSINP